MEDIELYESATQEYEDSPSPVGASGVPSEDFKVNTTHYGERRLNESRKVSSSSENVSNYTTFGELAKERNATKWHIPEGCITVSVKCAMENADVAPGYFYDQIKRLGGKGTYIIYRKIEYGDWTTYKFDKEGFCPLCHEVHDSYNFEYKIKKNVYGGFKCWKMNTWATSFNSSEMYLFY
jgi:hypothetical protein